MINTELLLETLAYIEAHPEEWDQTRWRCGTSYCFAGHAARIANGGTLTVSEEFDAACMLNPKLTRFHQSQIRDEAIAALGINEYQANQLFHADNTLADLDCFVDDLCWIADQEPCEEE